MLKKIINKMQDEESNFLFEKKIESIVLKDELIYLKSIFQLNKDWICKEAGNLLTDTNRYKDIFIFGAKKRGYNTYLLLKALGCANRVKAFVDNNPDIIGRSIEDIPIVAADHLHHFPNAIILLASENYAHEIYRQLLTMYDIERENIIYPRNGYLVAKNGWQYFDVFEPENNEVFIDDGSSFGNTSADFIKWAKGNYEKIYAFDPRNGAEYLYQKSIEQYKMKNAYFINKGTWSEDGELHFSERGSASTITDGGKDIIQVTSIDHVLNGEKATFIKMDVEGAELNSLMGAQETIKKYKPKLAISLYHQTQDILEIPSYILELNSDYKFTIRQYYSNSTEMVLFAK